LTEERPPDTPAPLSLSVVIPTFQRDEALAVCLACLAAQTLPRERFDVVVVDDGGSGGTAAVVEAFADRLRARSVRQRENRGRAAARNTGIREAPGDVIVFLDSDVFPNSGFLEAHARVHAANPRAVGRGPLLLTDRMEPARRDPPILRDLSPGFLDTANASVRRAHLMEAGGFDEGFRWYGWEDTDLGIRLQQRGLRRVFARDAVALHYQPLPREADLPALLRKEEERARMAVRFVRKHPGVATRLMAQMTPLHALLAFLMTAGGAINERNIARIVDDGRVKGREWATHLLLRGVLNRRYLRTLREEWQR
jgi:GT2 family glycosyltransferase